MEALLDELVRTVDAEWEAADHDPAAFPDIAQAALERADPHERVGLDEALDWLARAEPLPDQDLASGFGEPPLTLHADGRWAIQLLFWVDGRTTIHEHDFAGAFALLEGSSLERRYRFDSDDVAGAPVRIGSLALEHIAVLPRGAIRPIHPGEALIHSVFHLDRPTLTLVVRTEGGLLEGPQYDYWAPRVALDPHRLVPRSVRQVQLLTAMLRSGSDGWEAFAGQLLVEADLHHTFRILDLLLGMHDGGALPPGLLEVAAERHGGGRIDGILESLHHGRWEHAVTTRRDAATRPEHRFLLAALLTAPHREAVWELVRQRYPGRSAEGAVDGWVEELVAADMGGPPELTRLVSRAARALMVGASRAEAAEALRRDADPTALARLGGPDLVCAQLARGPLGTLFVGARET